MELDRRHVLAGASVMAAALPAAASSAAAAIDLSAPPASMRALARVIGDIGAPQDVFTWFGGDTFAVEGDLKPLTRLFRTEGFSINQIKSVGEDAFEIRERRLTLLKDPQTEEILDQWANPLTGNSVTVTHRFEPESVIELASNNDSPVVIPWVFNATKAIVVMQQGTEGQSGAPLDRIVLTRQFMAEQTDVANDSLSTVPFVGAFQETEPWPEWMGGSAEGYLFNRSFMRKLEGPEKLPSSLLDAARQRFPDMLKA